MQLPCRRLRRPRRVFRHGPAASCSAAMASRVSVSGMPGDASPDPATTSVATTVSASIKDCYLSRRAPRTFRRSREAAALPHSMPMPPVLTGRAMAHPSIRPRRLKPEMRRRGQSVPAGASPRTTPECVTVPEAAPERRQPQATTAAPAPDSRRLSGCPVWPRWLPTHRPRAAPNGVSVPLAPRRHQKRMFSSLAAAALHADLAPRHYRRIATASHAAQQRCDVVRHPGRVVTGRRGAAACAIGL